MTQYPTDLTEKQWQVIKNILEPQARNRKHPLKEIMNAILYINKTGCQWRMLPSDLAPWQTVYYYFRKWKLEGVFEEVMDALHSLIRKQAGREESPSLGIMDSKSVKTSHHVDSDRGIDGNKNYESHMHFSTDIKLLWQSIDWYYRHICRHCMDLGIKRPRNKHLECILTKQQELHGNCSRMHNINRFNKTIATITIRFIVTAAVLYIKV